MYNKNKSLSYVYLISDVISILVAEILSFFLRFGLDYKHLLIKWYLFAYIFILFSNLIIMYFEHLYDMEFKSFLSQVPRIINSFLYSMFIFFVLIFFIRAVSFSRLIFAYFAAIAIVCMLIGRYIAVRTIKILYSRGIGVKNLVVIGLNENSRNIIEYLDVHHEFGYKIGGYLDDIEQGKKLDYFGTIDDFEKVIEKQNISVILLSINDKDKINKIIQYCERNYVQVYMIPDIIDIISSPVEIGQISTIPLIMFKESRLSNSQLKLKRLFDIIASLVALFCLSPLFLILIVITKLTSEGPVFFAHTRMGMNGQPIKVYKFRTMVVNSQEILEKILDSDTQLAEEYRQDFKLKNDPRITKIGKWLRKTSIDELPQIINVLRGDMSIVGPRPIIPDELEKYKDYGKTLLKIPPGITGIWQTSGRNDLDYAERINLDMYYINNWSFWLDIIIILKTIPAVVEKKGAY